MPAFRYFLGVVGLLFFLAGCAGSYPEPIIRAQESKPANHFSGIVYSLKNRSNDGEIVATLLYSNGMTRYAGEIGVSCNGKAIVLQKDEQIDRKRVYLYSLCHRTGIINGLVVPRKTTPGARFFLVGTYLGTWSAGFYRELPNDMVLSPDGQFLYVGGDRGSIFAFHVRRSGQLKRINRPVRTGFTSDDRILSLGMTSNGTDLIVSIENKKRDFLKEFRIDTNSGKLHPEDKEISAPGPIRGLVAPDNLSNGNILGGILTEKGVPPSLVTFEAGDTFGLHPFFVYPLSSIDGRIHQVLFTPSGTDLFVMSEGKGHCSGLSGEIRRYFVGEYGRSVRPGPFICGPVGGGFKNAGWDWKDRLLISCDVEKIPEDPERLPKSTSGRVPGDHGMVFIPGGGGESEGY